MHAHEYDNHFILQFSYQHKNDIFFKRSTVRHFFLSMQETLKLRLVTIFNYSPCTLYILDIIYRRDRG